MMEFLEILLKKFRTKEIDEVFKSTVISVLKEIENDTVENHIHPLGFITLSLYKNEKSGESMKIHIWPRKKRPRKSKLVIHKHNNNLISYLLCGQLHNVEYYEGDADVEKKQVVFECGKSNETGDRFMTKTKRVVNISNSRSHTYIRDNFYEIKADVFHESAVPLKSFTATIIYSDNNTPPIVIGNLNARKEFITPKKEISQDQIKKYLSEIRNKYLSGPTTL